MRLFAYFLLLPLFVMFFSSCQKEITGESARPTDTSGNIGTGGSSTLVKTYTEDVTTASGNYKTTFDLSYDISDRITSMVSKSNAGDKFVYQYGTNKFTLDIYVGNVIDIHQDRFVNNMLLMIDSTLQYNNTGDTSTEKYTYNAAKQLTRKKDYEVKGGVSTLVNTTDYAYDSNGNVTKETDSDGETTYEYTTLVNNLNIGYVYFNVNKNLPKTTTIKGAFAGTITHTYIFDSLNRLTSEKGTNSNGGVFVKTYTY